MPLFRPSHIDSASPNAIDLRKVDGALFPREGVFPDPVTILPAGIAYGNGGWNVAARPFVMASKRGGAPYSLAYGTARGGNDAAGTAWTIAAAPGSGVRVDRLWVRFRDLTQGESLTGGLAVPEYGVTAGTPAIQPLPSGAVEIAQVSTPAGAASIAGSTITQTYAFAHTVGGTIYVRTIGERDALTNLIDGDDVYIINDDTTFLRRNGAWVALYEDTGWVNLTLASGATVADALTPKIRLKNGQFFLLGRVTQSGASIAQLPAGYAPSQDIRILAATGNSGAGAGVLVVNTAGLIFTSAGTTVNLAALTWSKE